MIGSVELKPMGRWAFMLTLFFEVPCTISPFEEQYSEGSINLLLRSISQSYLPRRAW